MSGSSKSGAYNRKSERFEFSASVDISQNHRRASFGTLIDISKDGVGFFADPPLDVGKIYLLTISGVGALSCKVLHRTGYNRYGGVLQISPERKRALEPKIRERAASSRKGRSGRVR